MGRMFENADEGSVGKVTGSISNNKVAKESLRIASKMDKLISQLCQSIIQSPEVLISSGI